MQLRLYVIPLTNPSRHPSSSAPSQIENQGCKWFSSTLESGENPYFKVCISARLFVFCNCTENRKKISVPLIFYRKNVPWTCCMPFSFNGLTCVLVIKRTKNHSFCCPKAEFMSPLHRHLPPGARSFVLSVDGNSLFTTQLTPRP